MKKKIIIFLIIISSFLLTGCSNKFSFEKKYYEKIGFTEIEKEEYNNLVKDKESFGIFIYQPLCNTSYEFEKVVNNFMDIYNMNFYKMSFKNLKETSLKDKVKYYPSFIIIKNGEVIDYLDANSDLDKNIYKSVDNFSNWMSNYVKIEVVNEDVIVEEENKSTIEKLKIDAELENVKYDENKVNIYFFWGNGCPHCEEEFQFFESIENEYGKYFNLNTFETWYNENNRELLEQFASNMGEEVTGVPYTIIGDKTFSGFGAKSEEEMLETIKNQYKNSYDVYFDNIEK